MTQLQRSPFPQKAQGGKSLNSARSHCGVQIHAPQTARENQPASGTKGARRPQAPDAPVKNHFQSQGTQTLGWKVPVAGTLAPVWGTSSRMLRGASSRRMPRFWQSRPWKRRLSLQGRRGEKGSGRVSPRLEVPFPSGQCFVAGFASSSNLAQLLKPVFLTNMWKKFNPRQTPP